MKKSLLVALVGFMFLAFASCSGSAEYELNKKMYKATKAQLEKAKTCEDLQKVPENALKECNLKAEDLFKKFEGKDTMTAKEKEEVEKWEKEIEKLTEEKTKELCKK